jgi:hypothetical protein
MASKGYVQTEDHKKNIRRALNEYYLSPASQKTRRRLAEVARSRPPISNETKERMSRAQKLRYQMQPHPKPNQGKHLPQQWCRNISKGLKHYYKSHTVSNKGKQHSQLTKRRISEAMLQYWQRRKKEEGT